MATLDFRKNKKNFLKITLNDENETKLSLMQPTKRLFGKMVQMGEEIGRLEGVSIDAFDEIYNICAELMSRNREGIEVKKEEIEEMLDFEDIVTFLQTYNEFVSGMVLGKN